MLGKDHSYSLGHALEVLLLLRWDLRFLEVSRSFLRFLLLLITAMPQALERASRDQIKYEHLLRSTIGVVFLGTPLRGTATASIAEWVAVIRGFMGKETSRTLLQSLKDKASSLDTLVHDFSKMAIVHNFQIRCFYETRSTQIAHALSRRIAKLSPFSEVEVNLIIAFAFYLLIGSQ